MQALTFVLEATLLAPLVEFATSSSGHVEPRQGLALGWLGSVVAGLAVVFGTADRAQADYCQEGYACSHPPVICKTTHWGSPVASYEYFRVHRPGDEGCEITATFCTCPP